MRRLYGVVFVIAWVAEATLADPNQAVLPVDRSRRPPVKGVGASSASLVEAQRISAREALREKWEEFAATATPPPPMPPRQTATAFGAAQSALDSSLSETHSEASSTNAGADLETTTTFSESAVEETPCDDSHEQCLAWSSRGECEANTHFMKSQCQKSCGLCSKEAVVACADVNDMCEALSQKGECDRNRKYMHKNCVSSCGKCRDVVGTAEYLKAQAGNDDSSDGDSRRRRKDIMDGNVIRASLGTVAAFVKGPCEDKHVKCATWSAKGECTNNPVFMKGSCEVSCGFCTATVVAHMVKNVTKSVQEGMDRNFPSWAKRTTSCTDGHQRCPEWSIKGECDNNPVFMHSNCRAACGLCGDTNVAQQAEVHIASTPTTATDGERTPTTTTDGERAPKTTTDGERAPKMTSEAVVITEGIESTSQKPTAVADKSEVRERPAAGYEAAAVTEGIESTREKPIVEAEDEAREKPAAAKESKDVLQEQVFGTPPQDVMAAVQAAVEHSDAVEITSDKVKDGEEDSYELSGGEIKETAFEAAEAGHRDNAEIVSDKVEVGHNQSNDLPGMSEIADVLGGEDASGDSTKVFGTPPQDVMAAVQAAVEHSDAVEITSDKVKNGEEDSYELAGKLAEDEGDSNRGEAGSKTVDEDVTGKEDLQPDTVDVGTDDLASTSDTDTKETATTGATDDVLDNGEKKSTSTSDADLTMPPSSGLAIVDETEHHRTTKERNQHHDPRIKIENASAVEQLVALLDQLGVKGEVAQRVLAEAEAARSPRMPPSSGFATADEAEHHQTTRGINHHHDPRIKIEGAAAVAPAPAPDSAEEEDLSYMQLPYNLMKLLSNLGSPGTDYPPQQRNGLRTRILELDKDAIRKDAVLLAPPEGDGRHMRRSP